MKKSKLTAVILTVVVLAVVGVMLGCSLVAAADDSVTPQTKTIKLAHVSDIHVMIEEYCNTYSSKYQADTKTSKMLEQTEALNEAVFQQIIDLGEDAPDYVFVTGDLTSNGELVNNLWLAKTLRAFTAAMREIKGAGFQVFVTPGNHDINNQNSGSYMPTQAEIDACGSKEELEALLTDSGKRSAPTTGILEFMTIYSDFGFCNCPDKANGHHLDECGMAEGCSLDFFYESDYWYTDQTPQRSERPETIAYPYELPQGYEYTAQYANPDGGLLEADTVPQDVLDAFDASEHDYRILAPYYKHGACSYIARVDGMTVLSYDGNNHAFEAVEPDETDEGILSSRGWDETTGGFVSQEQMQWGLSAVQQDIADGQLVVGLGHINILPHFDTEDELISLFTYDNWEQLSTNLADNGVHYVFTGHQHTHDIETAVTQQGNVLYDFQTGSVASFGSGWREINLQRMWNADGSYAEDWDSTIHFVHYNEQIALPDGDTVDAFGYDLVQVDDSGKLVKNHVYQQDASGNYVDMAEMMGEDLANMLSNIAGNYVNDGLYDMVRGMLSGLQNSDSFGSLYPLLMDVIDDLENLDLIRMNIADDGQSFQMDDTTSAGYDLVAFAEDLVSYLFNYDFSAGSVQGGYRLGRILWQVYGGHLVGANDTQGMVELDNLYSMLETGEFLRFVEDLIYRAVLPQVEVILDAPIYWGNVLDTMTKIEIDEDGDEVQTVIPARVTAQDVAGGKGFDLSENADALADLTVMGLVKVSNVLKYADKSSLMSVVKSLPILIDRNKVLIDTLGGVTILDKGIKEWLDLAVEYIEKLDDYGSLSLTIKGELLDKYVTDAFCKNIGDYGNYLLKSVVYDDSPDGVLWNADKKAQGSYFPFDVVPHMAVRALDADGNALYKVGDTTYTYYRDSHGIDNVAVTPTKTNGMLPGKITIGNVIDNDGKLVVSSKEVRWFTNYDVDVFDLDANGVSKTQPAGIIRWGTDPTMTQYDTQSVTGTNVAIEYPTIDLGITFFNLTYAFREYNVYELTLTDLQPNTTYYYQLGGRYGWTETYSFSTTSAEGGFEFVAITDIQGSVQRNYTSSLPNLKLALMGIDPAYILACGDNVDKGENINQWTWMLDDQAEIWANNTMVNLAGNHEDDNYSLSTMIAVPDTANVNPCGVYYSYDQQNAHFVILDTNDLGADNALSATQTEWLVADLDAANANPAIEFIIVALHKGPYTAGSHAFDSDVIALRAQLTPIFAEKGVDLVLQGHDHTYSLSQYIGADGKPVDVNYDAMGAAIDPDGVLYINLGTMGDKFYNYIYSASVSLADRSNDAAVRHTLADYVVDGNLELTETPVYTHIRVQQGRLCLTSYTVIDGISYVVDDVAITKNAMLPARSVTVFGHSFDSTQLQQLDAVRFAVNTDTGIAYYRGYRLADLLAAAGDKRTDFTVDNVTYQVADAYVALYRSDAGDAEVQDVASCVVYTDTAMRYTTLPVDDLTAGLPVWATVLIVIAAVLIAAGIVIGSVFGAQAKKKKALALPTHDEGVIEDSGTASATDDSTDMQ